MIHYLDYKGCQLRYSDKGTGAAVVFLHGYLLALDVWLEFVEPLTTEYRVICMDLPGHGESGLLEPISTMEVMADSVKAVLDHLNVDQAFMFGHSMGGYTTLAFLEKWPERLSGIGLFHSHTLADSEEVRTKRDREIALIEKGHRALLVSQSIPNMFATDRLEEHKDELELCKKLALQMKDEEVIAAIKGLRARPDRSSVLSKARIPAVNIIGKLDNFINYELVAKQVPMPDKHEIIESDRTGHMGFFEDPEFLRSEIAQFLKSTL